MPVELPELADMIFAYYYEHHIRPLVIKIIMEGTLICPPNQITKGDIDKWQN